MADITISDLELAPALADDMVFPVENTTDTYAATLAMLRRLINKTFVEVENADFNALTDDGFYQCTGTPTNSPEAGAINWTLQVSAENGVVVQRAFSLDDNFANLYIRRWNGVTWTGWLDVGKGALDNKANINLDNLSATGEAKISGVLPTGSILPYGGSTAPTGWLLCNGGTISRTTYENLFAVIGTSYGAGDGSTTFNLPNSEDIITNINTDVPCKGNGLALGLMGSDGVNGTGFKGGLTNINNVSVAGTVLSAFVQNYGVVAGANNGSPSTSPYNTTAIGITSDQSKSGIVGTITSTKLICKLIIKY